MRVRFLWSTPRRAYASCLALGLVLALPALLAPFAIDDFFHLASLEGAGPAPVRWWELFTFTPADSARRQMLVASGALPWWTAPDLHMVFFRPLSSALVTFDHAVFGRNAVAWHLDSLVWWAALLAAAALLYRRVLPAGLAAFALLLFTIDDSHWMPIVWSAARNGLVAMVPALLGLLAHLRWREQAWRPGAVLGPVAFAVGLAGGEMALGVLAYVVAFEIVARTGERWGRRLLALAPYFVLLVLYALVRSAAGAGVSGSGSYIDPTGDPLTFAWAALGRVPALIGNAVLGVPSELWAADARFRPGLIVIGLLVLVGTALWFGKALPTLPAEEARSARWLALGSFLALIPGAGAMIGERVLLPSSVGAAAIFALLLRDGLRRWRALWQSRRRARAVAGVALTLLAVPNLVLAGPLLVGKIALWKVLGDQAREQACAAPLVGPGPVRAVVVWAENPAFGEFGGGVRWFYCLGNTISWTVLSMAPQAQVLTRRSPTDLELRSPDRPLLASEWETLFRAPDRPMRVGDSITQEGGLRIAVEAVDDGRPTQVLFRFPAAIEQSEYRLLIWRGGRLAPLALPPMGGSVAFGARSDGEVLK